MKKITKREWIYVLLFYGFIFILYLVISPKAGHDGDANCWKGWMNFYLENSISNIYNSGTDYLPLYNYILFGFAKFQGSVAKIEQYWYLLKHITLLFELAIAIFIFTLSYKKTNNFDKSLLHSLFYSLNILVLYNSVVWGQVDGIFTSFALFSVYAAYNNKILPSLLFLVIALNFKLQAIVFVPLIGILLLPMILQKKNTKIIISSVIAAILLQLFILLPFIINGTLPKVIDVVFNSFVKYPAISMNAYNFWYLFQNENLMAIKDDIKFAGITYKNWGLFFFFLSSFFALFPLLKETFLVFFNKKTFNFSLEKTIIIASLIPLLFFYFNTEMHERYSHPTFPFLAILAIVYNKPFAYIVGSIAYFQNLESVLKYLCVPKYSTVIFAPYIAAILFAIVIISLYKTLYKKPAINLN